MKQDDMITLLLQERFRLLEILETYNAEDSKKDLLSIEDRLKELDETIERLNMELRLMEVKK